MKDGHGCDRGATNFRISKESLPAVTNEHFDPAHNDIKRHVTSGVFNSSLVQIVKFICQIGTVVILSRLLPPTDFGLLAMVNPVIGFAVLFQSLGLSQATVQRTTLTHDEVNAIFWINLAVGLALALALAALSPVVGWYYGDRRVVLLTAAMAGLVFTGSLGNQHGTLLQRRMQFSTLALIDVVGTVSALATSIVCALIFKNYWALYFGTVVGNVFPVIGTWMASKWRPSLPRRVSGLRDMVMFGAGVTSFGFTNFFARNLDNILIGRAWGGQALGFYDRAYKLMLLPLQRMVLPLENVMIPLLARIMDDSERYRRVYLKVLAQLVLAVWPGILWALILADTLIPSLLGPSWTSAVGIFQPLAVVGLIQVVNSTAYWLFVSQGRAGDFARWGVVNAVSCVIAFVVGLPYGAQGVAIAYAIGEILCTPFLWWYVTRRGPVRAGHVGRAIAPQFFSGIISALALWGFRDVLSGNPWWLLLTGGLFMAYATTGLVMLVFSGGRDILKETMLFLRGSFLQLTLRRKA